MKSRLGSGAYYARCGPGFVFHNSSQRRVLPGDKMVSPIDDLALWTGTGSLPAVLFFSNLYADEHKQIAHGTSVHVNADQAVFVIHLKRLRATVPACASVHGAVCLCMDIAA